MSVTIEIYTDVKSRKNYNVKKQSIDADQQSTQKKRIDADRQSIV